MGFGDFFITKKEDKKETEAKKETVNTPFNSINPLNTVNTNQNFTGVIDEKVVSKLEEIFKNANLPGPDLYEFVQALKTMEGQPIDEATKYRLTFSSMSVMGLTKAKMLEAAETYKKILSDVKADFENQFASKLIAQVESKRTDAEKLVASNVELQKQIEDINKKMSENLNQMQQFRNDANMAESELNAKKASFELTYSNFVTNNIDNQTNKINTYIQ